MNRDERSDTKEAERPMVFGFCVMCNAPQYTPKVCGSKTDPCPKCGWMYPLGDCSD